MEEYNNIVIETEDGESVEYQVLAIFEVEGNSYVALLPVDESNEITFFGCIENIEEEEMELVVIEDEEEFSVVSNSFIELMENYNENGME